MRRSRTSVSYTHLNSAQDDRGSLLNALRNSAQTESGETKMLVIGKNYRVLYPKKDVYKRQELQW